MRREQPSTPEPDEDSAEGLRTDATSSIVGYRLRRAQLSVFQRFLTVFESLALRPVEYTVLVLIADNPGRKQTEIAEVLGIKRANFVPLVHGLEQRGLVERVPSDFDKRANALHLTKDGETFLAHARQVHEDMEQELVARLGGEKARKTLLDLLDRLT
ncbi:MarR family transcriptional regulator [Devosia sp. 63-57]|uniref:MarR family winged helix-turn-helix transcriptional regulator n=1 Tax=Devosia sp. 63-57 TaxID=1895751 RepID=UPI000A887B59|nr:MarR family transcriptional regulator [Devosia sp. 63-57]